MIQWEAFHLPAPLPLNPAYCMAVGFAGPQRRVRVQTGLDLGLAKEKIKEQIHYLL